MRLARSGTSFRVVGIDHLHKGKSDADLIRSSDTGCWFQAEHGSLTFANFVEFDSHYGHRRDVAGYARAAGMVRCAGGGVFAAVAPQ